MQGLIVSTEPGLDGMQFLHDTTISPKQPFAELYYWWLT